MADERLETPPRKKRRWLVPVLLLAVVVVLANVIPQLMVIQAVTYAGVTRQDMRFMGAALDAYRTDHGSYPIRRPMSKWTPEVAAIILAYKIDHSMIEPGSGSLSGITTPISYSSTFFHDRFAGRYNFPFAYWKSNDHWLLCSTGPDQDYDIPADFSLDGDAATLRQRLLPLTYDPYNGTNSSGDIWVMREDSPSPRLPGT